MQGVKYSAWLRLRSNQEIESGKGAVDERVGHSSSRAGGVGCSGRARRRCRLRVEDRAVIRLQAEVSAGQKSLHAIAQFVGERDLRNRCVDCHLQLRLVDRPSLKVVVFLPATPEDACKLEALRGEETWGAVITD